MAQQQQWWESAPVVAPAKPDARPVVEFQEPQQPMSPAEAERLRLAREAEARAGRNEERAAAREERAATRPTQEQGQAGFLVARIKGGLSDIEGLLQKSPTAQQPGLAESVMGGLSPQGVGGLVSRQLAEPERRAVADAQSDMLDALLTLATGAAYTKEQLAGLSGSYFPQYGDTAEEIEIKNRRVLRAIEAAKLRAGPLADQLDEVATRFGVQNASGRIVEAPPGTAPGIVMSAMQSGQPVMSDKDLADRRALQEAWDSSGGNPEAVREAAARVGRMITPELDAFMRQNAGQRVQLQVTPTGTPTAAEAAVGEFVATPVGETIAAGALGSANAMTFGLLDELAPLLNLDPERVQMAKRYLQERNVAASLAGEVAGSILPGAAVARGVNTALAGTRAAGLAPVAGDALAGAAAGAGEANEERLGGALFGGAFGAGAGYAGRRVFGDGGGMAGPDGGVPSAGGAPMGGPVGGMGGRVSAGAAATPDDVVRYSVANELGIDLLPFQASRNFADNQRAHELAKNNEVGGPLREAFSRQQVRLAQKFDEFLEKTGAEIWKGKEERGIRVTKALEKMAERDKARVRTLYKQAEKSDDAKTLVPINNTVPITIGGDDVETSIVKYLADQPKNVPSSGVTDAAQQIALRLGVLKKDDAGNLLPGTPTVQRMEEFRREITGLARPDDPTGIRQETILKKIIDTHTEPYATGAYAKARAARREVAEKYQNVSTIAQLLGTKRNTPERVIAAEKVMDRLLSDTTSVANLRALKGLLTGEGGDPQAWKEVQGALVSRIERAAYPKGSVADEAGQKTLLPSGLKGIIRDLDENGKLDTIFDPEIARNFRLLSQVVEMIEPPRGTQNFSNTTSAFDNRFAAMFGNAVDAFITAMSVGVPLPTGATNKILEPLRKALKERPLRKEVRQLIGEPTP